ncbi:MAG: hypothetical protein ACRDH9_02645 [Actinomycetota bacterium]
MPSGLRATLTLVAFAPAIPTSEQTLLAQHPRPQPGHGDALLGQEHLGGFSW